MKEEEVWAWKNLWNTKQTRKLKVTKMMVEHTTWRNCDSIRTVTYLKYYYAVVECDCEGTASNIHDECDGQEFESSAAKLDLHFIPDEMDFDQKANVVCEAKPDVSQYEPRIFMNSALQQAQVNLTWDETNPDSQAAIQKHFPVSPQNTFLRWSLIDYTP